MSRGPNTDYNDFLFERAFIQREEEYRFPELIAELEQIELKCRTTDFVIDKQRGLQPLSIP